MAIASSDKKALKSRKTLLTARFSEIVALNFAIDPEILKPHVPKKLELDFFENETYVSLVAIVLKNIRVWGLPIQIPGQFGEFNLRFYVRRPDGSRYQRGVCFLRDYVSSKSAAWILGSLFKADFRTVKMQYENTGFNSKNLSVVPTADYRWQVDEHWNRIRVKARQRMKKTGPGTKVGFILDHANKYGCRDGATYEYSGTQPKWTIWDAAQANFTCDVKRLFGPEFEKPLAKRPASVFVATGSDVTIFRGCPLS